MNRKGFAITEAMIFVAIVIIIFSIFSTSFTVITSETEEQKAFASNALKVWETVYYDRAEWKLDSISQEDKTITITIPETRQRRVIKLRWLGEEEIKRLIEEDILYEGNFESDSFPFEENFESDSFPFEEGDIVRHELNGWRGIIIEINNNKATVRFQVGNDFRLVENLRSHEIKKSY